MDQLAKFKALPTDAHLRVTWFEHNNKPVEPSGPPKDNVVKFWRFVNNSSYSETVAYNAVGPLNPETSRGWMYPQYTGTAIAFFDQHVLVATDLGLVRSINPNCLINITVPPDPESN